MQIRPAKLQLKYRNLKFVGTHLPFLILSVGLLIFSTLSCSSEKDSERDHLVFRYNEHSNICSLVVRRINQSHGRPAIRHYVGPVIIWGLRDLVPIVIVVPGQLGWIGLGYG